MTTETQANAQDDAFVQFVRNMAILSGVILLAGIGAIAVAFAERMPDDLPKLALSSFGSFLLVGSTTSVFYQYVIRPIDERHRHERLAKLFRREVSYLERLVVGMRSGVAPAASSAAGAPAPGPMAFGLAAVEPSMNFTGLFEGLGKDDEVLWLDTYAPAEKAWTPTLRAALQRGASVRMLILNPRSKFVEARANEIGSDFKPEQFKRELESFTGNMKSIVEESKVWAGKLQIGIYDDLLGCPIYLIENCGHPVKAYSSLYLSKATGQGFPHLLWTQDNNGMLDSFKAYFEYKWEHAKK